MKNDNTTTVEELKDLVRAFIAEREWAKYHDPKNLSMSIAIEAAELMEHFQWLKSDELEAHLKDEKTRGEVGEELVDILSYVISLANVMKLDLSQTLKDKMEKNAKKYPAEDFKGKYRR
jgi:NTP pyrophosphatase (non-canonical NTP hydrolase)